MKGVGLLHLGSLRGLRIFFVPFLKFKRPCLGLAFPRQGHVGAAAPQTKPNQLTGLVLPSRPQRGWNMKQEESAADPGAWCMV
jgi:hypothetical protein